MRHILAGAAESKNLDQSIRKSLSLEEISSHGLAKIQKHVLNDVYGNTPIYLWALSSHHGYEKGFNALEAGDILLLREKRQNNFSYRSNIVYAIQSNDEIGRYIWDEEGWTRLLFLKDIAKIDKPMDIIYRKLGYHNPMRNYPRTIIKNIEDENVDRSILNDVFDDYNLEHLDESVDPYSLYFIEGKKIEENCKRCERDRHLRELVISQKGCKCSCCGFDFEDVYGKIGKGFIHIHHTKPLHTLRGETMNNIKDLEPICPNCHAMIHRDKNKIYSIERLKEIMQHNKNK